MASAEELTIGLSTSASQSSVAKFLSTKDPASPPGRGGVPFPILYPPVLLLLVERTAASGGEGPPWRGGRELLGGPLVDGLSKSLLFSPYFLNSAYIHSFNN